MNELISRVEALERRVNMMENASLLFVAQMAENTTMTQQGLTLAKSNNELLGGIKNALRVFAWLGEALKWGAPIAGSITAIWMAVRGWKTP